MDVVNLRMNSLEEKHFDKIFNMHNVKNIDPVPPLSTMHNYYHYYSVPLDIYRSLGNLLASHSSVYEKMCLPLLFRSNRKELHHQWD